MTKQNRPIQGAIFDLDGTLLDSMPWWDTIGSTYLLAQGIEPAPDIDEIFKTFTTTQAAHYYIEVCGLNQTVDEIKTGIIAMAYNQYANHIPCKPGVPAFLAHLKACGIPSIIVTASERPQVEVALAHTGIADAFHSILTCTEAGCGKDTPDIFNQAAQLIGADPAQTLVFEDAPHAITTAHQAGYPVIGVADSSWGDRQNAIRPLCQAFIHDFTDKTLGGLLP